MPGVRFRPVVCSRAATNSGRRVLGFRAIAGAPRSPAGDAQSWRRRADARHLQSRGSRAAALATPADNVRFVRADVFTWRPDRRDDAVFVGFWLSHIPDGRCDGVLRPGGRLPGARGRVLFTSEAYRTADELI